MRTTFTMVAILSTLLLRSACANAEEQNVAAGGEPSAVTGSCAADADCDDGDVKTRDVCQRFMNDQEQADSRCVHEPVRGECGTNADCDDGDAATRDTCLHTVGEQGEPAARCMHEPTAGEECRTNSDCDDGDPATRDYCQHVLEADRSSARCGHDVALAGCRSDRDCDDADSCTRDRCVRSVTENGEAVSSCSHVADGACQRVTSDETSNRGG